MFVQDKINNSAKQTSEKSSPGVAVLFLEKAKRLFYRIPT